MVLYLKMDQKNWAQGDYTDSNTYDLSGVVYDENTLTTARDISSFTVSLRILDQRENLVYSTSTGLTNTGSSGVFLIKFTNSNTPYLYGSHKIRLRLEDSTNRITAIGVNGSDEIFFDHD